MTSEHKLIKECRRGKARYQKMLYKRYAPKMFGVCARYFTSLEEAQDALQDGFVKVFENLHSFQEKGSLEGWIRRIMVNTSLNLLRKNQKYKYHIDIDETESRIEDKSASFDQLEFNELLQMIQDLPKGYRTVFNLYEIDGYSHQEIAEMLGVSINTSKSQLLKAKRKLRLRINRNN